MNGPIIVPPPPVHVPGGQSGGDSGGHPLPWTVTQWAWVGGLALLLVALIVAMVVIEVRHRRGRKAAAP